MVQAYIDTKGRIRDTIILIPSYSDVGEIRLSGAKSRPPAGGAGNVEKGLLSDIGFINCFILLMLSFMVFLE
ncbi:MAG TPA: hypothetical protein ENH49_05010 [Candidatus Marinimicrobia bacterium]|nr:hypothetical protein [Candidatus Neomarinimicrobiota bacterium]